MSEQKSIDEWMEDALCRRLGLPTDIFSRDRCTTPSRPSKHAGTVRSAASVLNISSGMRREVQRRLQGFSDA